eukprot:Cvel_36478.t1-p1 / transcript=Cvel_36478.t1 / gene=Cvel_36478 / organism=Chromera_velia_CCMP2878 / gene_product=hypothetical protein / transcript_product=hypothetical protein / location=Cvel_scaffold7312:32-1882(+) / protein_length=617 / sequence_SO=supercontig / SO=protein_coding / is_pseudo=false
MGKSCVSAENKASVRWLHSSLRSPDDTESFSKALSAAMQEISSPAPSADPTQSGAGLWQHAAFPFAPLTHPLVGKVVDRREGTRVQAMVRRDVHALVDDYDLRGEIVVPGAHHLDMMAACVGRLLVSGRVTSGDVQEVDGEKVEGDMPRPRVCLENVFFERPLMLPHLKDLTQETRHRVTVSVSPSREVTLASTGGAAESQSDSEESEEGVETHVRADVSGLTAFKQTEVDIEALKKRLPQKADIEAFYKGLKQIGYILGPRFRTVREAWISEEHPNEILAALRPEPSFDDQKGERMREVDLAYDVHPAVLDGCFQASALRFAADNQTGLFVPVEIESVVLGCLRVPWDAADKPTAFVHAELVSKTESVITVNVRLTDAVGRVAVEVLGLTSRPMDVSRAAPIPRDLLWSVAWKRASLEEVKTEAVPKSSRPLFVNVSAEYADAIARLIPNSKILPSVSKLQDSQLLDRLIDNASGCDQILFLGSAGEGVERADGAAAVVWEATRVLQAVSSPEWPKETPRPSVRFVTVGEQSSAMGGSADLPVPPAAARGSHCGLLGLARSAAVEMQNFGVKVGSADLDPTAPVPFPEAVAELVRLMDVRSSETTQSLNFEDEVAV